MIPFITDDDIDEVQVKTGLIFDNERRQAIKSYSDIQACPGSGKTTLIAAKLILLARNWRDESKGICVLSHTNVAKNEIIQRLEKSESGRKLLSYPHFIGTIQEFVNRFLAKPFCRSKGIAIKQIDDDACVKYIEKRLSWKTKRYLEGKPKANISDLQIRYVDGDFEKIIPGFTKHSSSDSYKCLLSIKESMIDDGIFFFREMFEYAQAYLKVNSDVILAIRSRFPLALVDEMQDTSLIQDEILNKIFLYEGSLFQRFGDADQAIFLGDDENSNSYNTSKLKVINTSHRFNSSVALLATRLSTNRISLVSTQADATCQPHTIFIVDESSRRKVLKEFAILCSSLPIDNELAFKAVGGVGKAKKDGLTLQHYFPTFDKGNSNKHFKPKKLIGYFRLAKEFKSCTSSGYKIILEGISRLLSLAGYNYLSVSDLREIIRDSKEKFSVNEKIIVILISDLNDEASWYKNSLELLRLIGLKEWETEVTDYISFSPSSPELSNEIEINNSFVEVVNDRDVVIEIDTIHSVKGETHSATLLLETKYYQYDIHQVLDNIVGLKSELPKGARKKKFMKQIYVAMTRPKYLIGITVDNSRITSTQKEAAVMNGWRIVDLTEADT
ncbi:UvrD-helicase domain-containing protein [Alteromonas confluentis]|uniref:DNA 3'-5' helicase II n=1 Tax=Alteromonas confluentis TaxID=1656094 RepID=A0A1E7ZBI0_9ALTE|nr:UvrD-helicase domain-containing protein [Alteromonas confluentis]OFC70821.1 hypothetical protein BFC18_10215 [Alteromonas confluentis]